MVHLGGDEVDLHCYDENPAIQQFMKDHNLTSYKEMVSFHIAKVREILTGIDSGKQALYWSNVDTFYQKYKAGDILMYWDEGNNIQKLKQTYPDNFFVMAPVDYYYLDCSYGNKYGGNSWCDPMKTWFRIYSFEPSDYLNDGSILGSEVPVWSEIMSDQCIHAKIWPRAASMPDKHWSAKGPTDLVALSQRLNHFNTYLTERLNLPTSSITGQWCESYAEHCFGAEVPKARPSLYESSPTSSKVSTPDL